MSRDLMFVEVALSARLVLWTCGGRGRFPMLFAWMGFLKADADPVPQSVQHQTNEFLQQPYIKIHSVGQLRAADGRRAGMMMIFEVEDRAAAEALVESSPYRNAGLYEDYGLYEYANEVG